MLKTPEIRDRHRFPQAVRACMTADTIESSTGPQIRNTAPVVNLTSITPGDAAIGAASVGTSNVNDANRAAPCSCRRQRNSWLACIPASRATADATAPGAIAAARMRSFWALDHLRRCGTKVTISSQPRRPKTRIGGSCRNKRACWSESSEWDGFWNHDPRPLVRVSSGQGAYAIRAPSRDVCFGTTFGRSLLEMSLTVQRISRPFEDSAVGL